MDIPQYVYEYAIEAITRVAIPRVKALPDSEEKTLAITKLEEAQMLVEKLARPPDV